MTSNRLKRLVTDLGIVALVVGLTSTQAKALDLSPSTTGVFGANLGSANCEAGCVYDAFGLTNDGSLELYYKADLNSDGTVTNSGSFSTSYLTTFDNSPTDPQDATITYVSGSSSIGCPSCYLAIKDGNQNPSYYFYDLSSWNGTEVINLSGFWPGRGAISHVSIWGTPTANVPEPSTLLLLGAGLAGIGIWRRKSAQA